MSEESTNKTPSRRSPSKVAGDPHQRPRHKPSTDGSSTRARHRPQNGSDPQDGGAEGAEDQTESVEEQPAEEQSEEEQPGEGPEDPGTEEAVEASSEEAPRDAQEEAERSGGGAEVAEEMPEPRELTAVSASREAIAQFHGLTGRSPEAVVGVSKSGEGWKVRLEVVEARRIPDSSDLLAEYDVDMDARGEIVNYARGSRYVRGRPG